MKALKWFVLTNLSRINSPHLARELGCKRQSAGGGPHRIPGQEHASSFILEILMSKCQMDSDKPHMPRMRNTMKQFKASPVIAAPSLGARACLSFSSLLGPPGRRFHHVMHGVQRSSREMRVNLIIKWEFCCFQKIWNTLFFFNSKAQQRGVITSSMQYFSLPGQDTVYLPWADTVLMLDSFQRGSFHHFPR